MMIKSFAGNLLIMVYSCVFCCTLFRGNLVCGDRTQGLVVTQSVDSSSDNSVTLDCPIHYDKNEDQKLIFKWYYNNDRHAIYQWIVEKNTRIYSEEIKQYVDQNYTVDDQTTRYRALRFTNLNLKLNGNYTCFAHSLNNNYDITIRLIIYVGAKELNVDVQRVDNGVNVTCSASGLFPMPELTLYRYPNNDSNLIQITQNTTTVTEGESGKYSIWLTSIISEDKSSSSDIPDHYECRLQLPDTDYMLQKTVALQAGWHTRPHHDSSSNKSYEIHLVLLTASLLLPLLAVIINIS